MLDKLPQSILAKAFHGELPQNPEDELAGMLLERIKAEKMKLGSKIEKRRNVK